MEKLPNLHELSEERKNLKGIIDDSGESETIKKVSKKALEENRKEVKGSIEKHGGLSKAKEHYKQEAEKSENDAWINETSIENTMGDNFKELSILETKKSELRDFEMQRLRVSQSDPNARKSNERLLKTIQKDKVGVQESMDKIEKKDPRTFRALELVNYKKGLHEEGHIAPTPSVVENLDKIGRRMITGKPMFLHGPTGTGKTSLGRFAAKHFTGNDAEMVYCNPQTRESSIWGKTGIKPTESGGIQTVDIFGPLSKAMVEGRVAVFDEFTALPKEQMVMIKGVFNAKVGDMVNIVGNGKVEIAPGFQMIFTANLKSDKNPERQELPPEITREFEQNNLEVSYTPKEEAYDIMLARLMNPDGSVDMSWYDLNTTLPKLCEAMEEIQIAYTDKEREGIAKLTGTMDASGKRQGLKKFVMTQGTIEAILEDWKIEKQIESKPKSFVEFMDERLATGITFKEYSETDRILASKILASKGFLRTMTAEDLSLPKNTFDFDAAKKQRGDKDGIKSLLKDSSKVVHLSIKELADMDPFGLRKKAVVDIAEQFLAPEAGIGDDFSKGMKKRLDKVLGKKSGVEVMEIMGLDLEKALDKYTTLFQETGIALPDDFREQVEDIWMRNGHEIEEAIKEKGFDDMIIAPAGIPLTEITEKMKMANGYFTGSNFDSSGGFAGAISTGVDKPRIILVHKAQNIVDHPELVQTKGIKAEDIKIDESLSLEDYLYLQRSYFKETGKHLDEDGWTWTPRTKSGARFVGSYWYPASGRLNVDAGAADRSNPNLGCRSSRYFT
jgi:hypothetical protein